MKIDWILPIGINEIDRHVIKCVKSLLKIIDTNNDRLIVVCDEKQWKKYDIISKNILLIKPPEIRNAAAYRNMAMNEINADIIAFQDADDVSLENRREWIEKNADKSDMIAGNYFSIDNNDNIKGQRKLSKTNNLFFFRNNIPLPTLAVRASILKDLKFDESLIVGEDNVFISKLLNMSPRVSRSNDPILLYRISDKKNLKRQGIKGIIGEWKYRKEMMTGSNYTRKLLIIIGLVFVSLIKLMPKTIFKTLYNFLHSR